MTTSIAVWGVALLVAVPPTCFAQAGQPSQAAPMPRRASRTAAQIGSMVKVRGGTIQVGIDAADIPGLQKTFGIDGPQLFHDELPRHSVTIGDFYIDAFPVTNAQYKQFTQANPQWRPDRIPAALHNGNYLKQWKDTGAFTIKADHPVVYVSWYSAVAYCAWAGKRLPTEAEWEHAARGGREALFPWGNEPADKTRVNFSGGGLGTTSPVGTYPPNGYGLFDMAGNVWEFLADEWKPYPAGPQKNPLAGEDRFVDGHSFLQVKTRRVIRGGSFGGEPVNFWVEYRDSHPPNDAREFVGFRCAK